DAQSELERVSARVSAVESDLKRYRSFAEAQAALGRLYDAVGIDPVPDELASLDIATLSAAIRRSASDWDNNRLDLVSKPAPAAARAGSAIGWLALPPVLAIIVMTCLSAVVRAQGAGDTMPPLANAAEIRAQLTARNYTTLSSEASARIDRIATRVGERFKKGD